MAMTTEQIARLSDGHLLAKIAEEASEVIKAAMKFQAHGARPLFEGVQYNNVADCVTEFRQLEQFMSELIGRHGAS